MVEFGTSSTFRGWVRVMVEFGTSSTFRPGLLVRVLGYGSGVRPRGRKVKSRDCALAGSSWLPGSSWLYEKGEATRVARGAQQDIIRLPF